MIAVYVDYACPFAWRGLELAHRVAAPLGLEFEVRHYSLEQGNHPQNAALPRGRPAWRLAEQPLGADPKSRLPVFFASLAARQQGNSAHERFALELFRLRHREGRDLLEPGAVEEAARRAELEPERFARDRADEAARRSDLAADLGAADDLAVFGTPTFVLPSGHAAYLRFRELPATPEAAVALWRLYEAVLESPAGIETVKRPRRPA